jgi:hypothetical protein
MNNFNFNDCRKAVNQASFRPTAARKEAAVKLLMDAILFINDLEEVKEAKPKAKAKAVRRRRKTTKKATPQQRVADKQEKAFHGKADTPVAPTAKPRKASAEAAKASLAEMDEKRALAKAKKVAVKKVARGVQPTVEDDSRIASLEAKIEALTACLAVAMESMTPASPANEVSIEDINVPF